MKKLAGIAALAATLAAMPTARAQAPAPAPAPPPAPPPAPASPPKLFDLDRGLRLDFDDDGARFVRFMVWTQLWARYDQYNPDSQIGAATPKDGLDVGMRSARFLIYGKPHKDLLFLLHVGINNQSTVGGGFGTGDTPKKPQLFVHEAWGEYRFADYLYAGAGLIYWNGISRLASASTNAYLTLDAPISNWPNLDKSDQTGRMLGVYVKGKIEKFAYRVAVNAPFVTGNEGLKENKADYAGTSTKAVQGYFKYDFLEAENETLPYYAGTYLGKKRVWNVGAGFYFQPDAMAHLAQGKPVNDKQLHLGVDSFVDLPFGREGRAGALTAYAGFVHYDFGPNFLRSIGIMNPSTAVAMGAPGSANGPGNAVPTIGTGNTYVGQLGYLLPDVFGRAGQLQPYANLRVSTFQALDGPVVVPEAGVNWLLAGHHAKFTVDYKSRPVFAAATAGALPTEQTRKSELTLQAQAFY
jgi:hypothetical protein